MKRHCAICLLMLSLSCAPPIWAVPVVEWNTVSGGGGRANFGLYTDLTGSSDAGIEGTTTPNDLLGNILLLTEGGTVACAHSWFPVIYGSLVDEAAWQTATDFLADIGDSYDLGSLTLTPGEALYSGFRLDAYGFPPYIPEYGWAELFYDGTTISVVSSATERTGLGIYAGTGMAIPEPSSMGLLAMGALCVAWRRSSRKPAGIRSDRGTMG